MACALLKRPSARSLLARHLNTGSAAPFAYGVTNVSRLREQGSFFVDNTRFIKELHEKAPSAFLHRPPRFGKSLFLSTLEAYYDAANTQQQRDALFRGLDVLEKPECAAPGAGKYFVLKWNLSVEVGGEASDVVQRLNTSINDSVTYFANKYNLRNVVVNDRDFQSSFRSLVNTALLNHVPLLLLIDEYDRFANKLLFEKPSAYEAVVRGASGQRSSSMLRSIFESIKAASSEFPLATEEKLPFRVFASGLCPLALSDASGANDMDDITREREFAEMFGFKKADLENALQLLVKLGRVQQDQVVPLLALMEKYFNGYKFHPAQKTRLYNPTLCLRLLSHLSKSAYFAATILANPPDIEDFVRDDNTSLSDNVFDFLAHNPNCEQLVLQLNAGAVPLTRQVERKLKMRDLTTHFAEQAPHFLLSFMHYHGVVTYGDAPSPGNLQIPNELARRQFLHRLEEMLQHHLVKFAQTLDTADLQRALNTVLARLTPMDDTFNEGYLKTVLLSLLPLHVKEVTRAAKGVTVGLWL